MIFVLFVIALALFVALQAPTLNPESLGQTGRMTDSKLKIRCSKEAAFNFHDKSHLKYLAKCPYWRLGARERGTASGD